MRNITAILTGMILFARTASGLTEVSGTDSIRFFKNLNEGKNQTVVLYGTSLTAAGAWPQSLRKWFDQQYPKLVTVVNSGGSGQNSDWGLANLEEKVLKHNPDLVIIEFSYNDAHEKFRMSPEKAYENLKAIVKGIKAKSPEVAIMLQIMNVPWDAPTGNKSAASRPKLERYNENYRRMAAENGFVLIDHYPEWKRISEQEPDRFHLLIPDGSHPTADGSREVIWPTIQKALDQLQKSAAK